MSQKSPHNSKRRPPDESARSPQQDADWGFDSDDADPAIEKKLAVLLVVCLLAGFGFVFYQKFRILRDDKSQPATAGAPLSPDADDSAEEPHSDSPAPALALGPVGKEQAGESQDSPAARELPSPFYEPPRQADAAAAGPGDNWNLAQAEPVPQTEPAASSSGLPPLPERDPADRFDPFATGTAADADVPSAAAENATPSSPALSEPPTLVWDDPPAPLAPAQTEPEPDPEPQQDPQKQSDIPSRNVVSAPVAQPDPFNFDEGSSETPQPPAESPALPVSAEPADEPQMLIIDDSQQTAGENTEQPTAMTIEPRPSRSPSQPTGPLDAIAATPMSSEPSGFDPFGGAAGEAATTDATGAASSTVADVHTDSLDVNVSADDDAGAFDPFPSAELPQVPTEPSPAPSSEPLPEPQPVSDPFSFPASGAESGAETSSGEPAFETLPDAQTTTPVWPESSPTPASQTDPGFSPFPSRDTAATAPAASRESTSPVTSFETADSAPPSDWPGGADRSTSAAANPFAFNAAASQPLAGPNPGGGRVVGEREVTVTPSDSFWSISEREYGSSRYFTALARYNQDRVDKPEHLQTGMKIVIPPPEVLEDRFPELFRHNAGETLTISPMSGSSSPAEAPAGLYLDERDRPHYRVGAEDTLSSIARQHLGRSSRWTEIYDLNKDRLKSPSTLTIGMELKLPPDASGVRVSPAGGFDR